MTPSRPRVQVTEAMSVSEATITPSRKAPATADLRKRGIRGLLAATDHLVPHHGDVSRGSAKRCRSKMQEKKS
jgi:hypothetical protein